MTCARSGGLQGRGHRRHRGRFHRYRFTLVEWERLSKSAHPEVIARPPLRRRTPVRFRITADVTRLWLHSRHPLLKGERVIVLINSDRTDEVDLRGYRAARRRRLSLSTDGRSGARETPNSLDALDALERVSFAGTVWRIVPGRMGRAARVSNWRPMRISPARSMYLYTSLAREGALEEIHFHLSRQPVFPSKIQSVLHRITFRTRLVHAACRPRRATWLWASRWSLRGSRLRADAGDRRRRGVPGLRWNHRAERSMESVGT